MAARKLQQEVDKCFKKVQEGVAEFESIYDKIEQSTNAAQKEKLEDNLKREIKKLQRLRDQIKTWAASNDIKDKGPLLENRKLIETVCPSSSCWDVRLTCVQQMEKFKAVEKAMKTKAYSKEGLSAAAKLDPKERAKMEACDFLSDMVEQLQSQIEQIEVEAESLQATMKKGKTNAAKADRMAEIERITERHKWHQGKLELIKRSLENGAVETDQVTDLEESIKYYVTDGMGEEYVEDEEMYDDLNLNEEEDTYGMNVDNDRVSSQDTQSVQEETPDPDARSSSIPGKSKATSVNEAPGARRASTQHVKSPLPTLATLHTPLSTISNGASMKPAAVPQRAPGETLKYASAAAAAAASDKSNMGIAPLPPPPESLSSSNTAAAHPPLLSQTSNGGRRPSVTASPTAVHSQPATVNQTPVTKSSVPTTLYDTPSSTQTKSPALSQSSAVPSASSASQPPIVDRPESAKPNTSRTSSGKAPAVLQAAEGPKGFLRHFDNCVTS
jgi:CCR4-NOT transcription complex subunit 3